MSCDRRLCSARGRRRRLSFPVFAEFYMDQSRYIAKHVVNLPKSGIRDFFEIVAQMKDASSFAA